MSGAFSTVHLPLCGAIERCFYLRSASKIYLRLRGTRPILPGKSLWGYSGSPHGANALDIIIRVTPHGLHRDMYEAERSKFRDGRPCANQLKHGDHVHPSFCR